MTIQTSVTEDLKTRLDVYRHLVSMMENLPEPKEISFSAHYPLSATIWCDTSDELEEWAKALGAHLWQKDHVYEDTIQSSGYGHLGDWSVSFHCVIRVQPEPSADPADAAAEVPEELAPAAEDGAR